jgi:hypothetical protein
MDFVGHAVKSGGVFRAGRNALALALSAGLALAQSCATADSHTLNSRKPATVERPAPATPLESAEPSAEALAGRVIEGLAAGDDRKLLRLVVKKNEFCSLVFPELPSSRLSNVTCDFVWESAMLNHESGYQEVLSMHKGRRYTFVSLRFEGGVQEYPSFRVHRDPVVTVRDEQGQQKDCRLFGPVLELETQFKLFGFMVD